MLSELELETILTVWGIWLPKEGFMALKEMEITIGDNLVVPAYILKEAGLSGAVRLLIEKGEICILSKSTKIDPDKILEELAGCLGQEPAADYDFKLKIGGLYEGR